MSLCSNCHHVVVVIMKLFLPGQVIPSKEQYLSNSYDRIKVRVKTHLGECHEEMMINSHKRNRVKGESKLKFQVSPGISFITLYKSVTEI